MAVAGEAVVEEEEEEEVAAGEEEEAAAAAGEEEEEVVGVGERVDGTKEDTVDMEEREDGTSIDFLSVASYAVFHMNSILFVLEFFVFFSWSVKTLLDVSVNRLHFRWLCSFF